MRTNDIRPTRPKPEEQCREAAAYATLVRKHLRQVFPDSGKGGSGSDALRTATTIEDLGRYGQVAAAVDAVEIAGYLEILISRLAAELDQLFTCSGRRTFGSRNSSNWNQGVFQMKTTIGKTIRILRSAKGKSLTELATESNLSVPFLSLVENGKRQPSVAVLKCIGDALGVSTEVLLLLEMGPQRTLHSHDRKTTDITASIEKLIEIEGQLRDILDTPELTNEPG